MKPKTRTPTNQIKKAKQFNFSEAETLLMATINALCTERTPYQANDITERYLPQLMDVLRIRNTLEEQHRLAGLLWKVYAEIIRVLPSGTQLDLDIFLPAFSKSLYTKSTENFLSEGALSAISQMAESIGFPLCAISPRLNQLIIQAQNVPSGSRWRALKSLNDALLSSSQLHEHFPQLAANAQQLINPTGMIVTDQKEFSPHHHDDQLFELIASIVRTSATLIKPTLLIELQRAVCLKALSSPNKTTNIGIIKILNALLENNHEAVQVPIQVARTVFFRDYSHQTAEYREEMLKGRILCQLYIRPKRIPCCGEPMNSSDDNGDFMKQNLNGTNSKQSDEPPKNTKSTFAKTNKINKEHAETSDSDSIIPLETDDEDNLETPKEADKLPQPSPAEIILIDACADIEIQKEMDTSKNNDFEHATTEEMLEDLIMD